MHPGTSRLSDITSLLEQDAGKIVGRLGDLRLGSHFQPIYSLSHARVVGHEALLRTRDAAGTPIPPPEVFASFKTAAELSRCDRLSRFVHMANFSAAAQPDQWLFLNVHPETFQKLPSMGQGGSAYLRSVQDHFNLPGNRVVLEVLESAVPDLSALEYAMGLMRAHGCLIAIDDFGAGHSNFDRVWRLQPDIVKLDRSLIARAARERRAQRVVSPWSSWRASRPSTKPCWRWSPMPTWFRATSSGAPSPS
jgi:EAL domain-containing protein (putative c-di-GMP-specific phosphodiesterase class I)